MASFPRPSPRAFYSLSKPRTWLGFSVYPTAAAAASRTAVAAASAMAAASAPPLEVSSRATSTLLATTKDVELGGSNLKSLRSTANMAQQNPLPPCTKVTKPLTEVESCANRLDPLCVDKIERSNNKEQVSSALREQIEEKKTELLHLLMQIDVDRSSNVPESDKCLLEKEDQLLHLLQEFQVNRECKKYNGLTNFINCLIVMSPFLSYYFLMRN